MIQEIQNDISFLEWSKQVSSQHPEILEYMRRGTNLLERVIAKRIIQAAGEDHN